MNKYIIIFYVILFNEIAIFSGNILTKNKTAAKILTYEDIKERVILLNNLDDEEDIGFRLITGISYSNIRYYKLLSNNKPEYYVREEKRPNCYRYVGSTFKDLEKRVNQILAARQQNKKYGLRT